MHPKTTPQANHETRVSNQLKTNKKGPNTMPNTKNRKEDRQSSKQHIELAEVQQKTLSNMLPAE